MEGTGGAATPSGLPRFLGTQGFPVKIGKFQVPPCWLSVCLQVMGGKAVAGGVGSAISWHSDPHTGDTAAAGHSPIGNPGQDWQGPENCRVRGEEGPLIPWSWLTLGLGLRGRKYS